MMLHGAQVDAFLPQSESLVPAWQVSKSGSQQPFGQVVELQPDELPPPVPPLPPPVPPVWQTPTWHV